MRAPVVRSWSLRRRGAFSFRFAMLAWQEYPCSLVSRNGTGLFVASRLFANPASA